MAKNPLLAAAGKLAEKAKAGAKSAAKPEGEGENGSEQATKVAGSALSVLSSLPWIKWVVIIAVLLFVFLLVSGVLTGVGNAINNSSSHSCTDPNAANKFIAEAEKNGETFSESDKENASKKTGNECDTGVGYTGQTYPPTTGRITAFFNVVDALHPRGHNGTDIADQCGTPIYAFAGGEVVSMVAGTESKSTDGGYAFPAGSVRIKHTEEFSSMYLHLRASQTYVKVGDIVNAGDLIATQWSNGQSTGCHLHLEMYTNGERIDANAVLAAAGYMYSATSQFTEAMMPPKPVAGEDASTVPYTPGSAQEIALNQVRAKGWGDEEFTNCLLPLWKKESGWRVNAINPKFSPSNPPTPEYQAYGIVQAAPGLKMASAGPDWKTNPATQITWGIGYIQARYGTPCGAWEHSKSFNWY